MAEYIDREALIARIEKEMGICNSGFSYNVLKYLKNSLPPIADVAEVKHGKWIYIAGNITINPHFRCSKCNAARFERYTCNDFKYCPNCGAKMDGGEK